MPPLARRALLGQQMLAVRANERAAAAAGINVARVKITADAISSFIAGTAGWMYAYNFGSVSAARFGILIALGFVAFAYIGGITMVSGAVIGGLVATEGLVPHFFQEILVLLVEQHIQIALAVADRGYVLSHGELVIHEATEKLRADHQLILSGHLGEQETSTSSTPTSAG